jgi:hypothetical protein
MLNRKFPTLLPGTNNPIYEGTDVSIFINSSIHSHIHEQDKCEMG